MAKITQAKANISEKHPVFYEDEANIDLNPKIGADWCFQGQQKPGIQKMSGALL
ncbi:hypothetical protein XNC1_2026 [Xenorhabdus nematophila ATCC 19061]|uniref:Uncharacterized protein n=1 Tax=Xenorhabdus nematophila (strain ATCC 19061 / DSM 3370 / CCUG 14189 / LMG 1036 / NCIMB 9965 / AN6) TaxID=406817 RepID=D3VE19_XENNA|nr:hypothetical protein [Xenorhabdus nematophila]CBJ90086.1 hypothetical protein XNC1_2026 [Xenorhabdus nematophila ATCC 19061]CEK22954.1 hypothetical protein XNC2_1960 [Xenorhabdus nematophila AN6/1]